MSHRPLFDKRIAAGPVFNRVRQPPFVPPGVDADTIIQMHYNESLVGPSPEVVKVVQEQAHLLAKYPPGSAELELRELLAAMHGQGITSDHLVTGNGGSEVMQFIGQGFLDAGDELILSPSTCSPTAFKWISTPCWLPSPNALVSSICAILTTPPAHTSMPPTWIG